MIRRSLHAVRSKMPLFWLLPALVTLGWVVAVCVCGRWQTVGDNLVMGLTMAFGSFIAGATSEGGGAVAFPVMTLLLNVPPPVARDFALMIQSVGMTMAACAIVMSRTKIEWRAVGYAGAGGAVGLVVGLQWLSPLMPPAFTKLGFVSLWLSFLLALWLINRDRGRHVHQRLTTSTPRQAALLMAVGLLGGMVSGLTGSGLDIVTFSLLVLWGRVSESVATPTSVVLMATNAVAGFAWQASAGAIGPAAWGYWWTCIPIVVWGAPLGAMFIRRRSRLAIARILYASIICQFVAALVIIPMTPGRLLLAAGVFGGGALLFWQMSVRGGRRLADEGSAPVAGVILPLPSAAPASGRRAA